MSTPRFVRIAFTFLVVCAAQVMLAQNEVSTKPTNSRAATNSETFQKVEAHYMFRVL